MNSPDNWAGVGLTSAPCTPEMDCCAKHAEDHELPLGGDTHDQGVPSTDCGCFDLMMSPNPGVLARPQAQLELSPLKSLKALPPTVVIVTPVTMVDAWLPRGARAGPPIVRLRVPMSRQTVLLI